MKELLIRFLIGGLVVSGFATLSDVLRPKTFAGLFGAAPSVALATLGLTILTDGKMYAAMEARSMIAGAVAFLLYAWITSRILVWFHPSALTATMGLLPVWVVGAFGIWFLFLRHFA